MVKQCSGKLNKVGEFPMLQFSKTCSNAVVVYSRVNALSYT